MPKLTNAIATEFPFCGLCYSNNSSFKFKYSKKSSNGSSYSVYECIVCNQLQIFPIPSQQELNLLYQGSYFSQRTDRGYHDYNSLTVKSSIVSTFEKNLKQLDFFNWEKNLISKKSLDVGCAGGHFVEYLHNRGWESFGIDVSTTMIEYAKTQNLKVIEGDFLQVSYEPNSFDLITFWATIEHLREPSLFLNKINSLIKPNGMIYISTCHLGFWAKIRGIDWRYLNVPEHIWYFSKHSLKQWGKNSNLVLIDSFTYGSGFTMKEKASWLYKIIKRIADFSAKKNQLGDMIVCKFRKQTTT